MGAVVLGVPEVRNRNGDPEQTCMSVHAAAANHTFERREVRQLFTGGGVGADLEPSLIIDIIWRHL